MATINKDKQLRPSILDRLIDTEPHVKVDSDKTRFTKLSELRNSVKRDLEKLLNTRCRVISPPEELTETQNTMLNYGLPDLATVNMLDLQKRFLFTRQIETVLKTYEPRFKSVKVSFIENDDRTDRTVKFRIDAVIWADPAPEIVIFDSVLEPVLRTVTVEDSTHG